jgi:RNA polymerase sigma-70 factor (ECF subfamily)
MHTIKKKRDDVSQYPDPDLVALARTGDGPAFAAIMTRYNQRLYRVARGVVRDHGEAEDVLQEAYMRAFAALPAFRGEASLSTWLTRIVLNEALGRLRRRRPTEELDAIDRAVLSGDSRVIMFPGVNAPGDPESAAARAEVRRLLEGAIDDLPEAFRVVFVMRDIEEMSVEETAGHLAIPAETVKTRLHRARRLLRKGLDAKLAPALKDTFPFQGARCARITDAVLARLGLEATSAPKPEAVEEPGTEGGRQP